MPDVDTLIAQADALRGEGRFEEAIEYLHEVVAQLPTDPIHHFKMGFCLHRLGRHEEAVRAFIAALNHPPYPVITQSYLAHSLNALGDNQNCVESCREFIEECRDLDDSSILRQVQAIYVLMGMAYTGLDKYIEAETVFKEALERNPQDTTPLYPLGRALLINDKVAEAIEVLERAVKVDPDDARAYFLLGSAYHKAGDFEAAHRQVKPMGRIDPELASNFLEAIVGLPEGFVEQQIDQGDKETARRAELLEPTWQFAREIKAMHSFDTPYGDIIPISAGDPIENRAEDVLRRYEAAYNTSPSDMGVREALADHLLNVGVLYYESFAPSMFKHDPALVEPMLAALVANSGRNAQRFCIYMARSFEVNPMIRPAMLLGEVFEDVGFFGTALYWYDKARIVAQEDGDTNAMAEATVQQSKLQSSGRTDDPLLLASDRINAFPTKDTVGLRLELQSLAEARLYQADAQARQAQADAAQHERQRQEYERQRRAAAGLCIKCGNPLGFMDKMTKRQAHDRC